MAIGGPWFVRKKDGSLTAMTLENLGIVRFAFTDAADAIERGAHLQGWVVNP